MECPEGGSRGKSDAIRSVAAQNPKGLILQINSSNSANLQVGKVDPVPAQVELQFKVE